MASSITTTSTTSTIRFTFRLSNAFNYANYDEIGVTDKPFTNDSDSLAQDAIKRSYPSDPGIEISAGAGITLVLTSWGNPSVALVPGQTYTFYGYAKSANGKYYQVPEGGRAVIVTTKSDAPRAPTRSDLMFYHHIDGGLDVALYVPDEAESARVLVRDFYTEVTLDQAGRTVNGAGTYGFTLDDIGYGVEVEVLARYSNSSGNSSYVVILDTATPPSRPCISEINYDYSLSRLNITCSLEHEIEQKKKTSLYVSIYDSQDNLIETKRYSVKSMENDTISFYYANISPGTYTIKAYTYGTYAPNLQCVDNNSRPYELSYTYICRTHAINKYIWNDTTKSALESNGYTNVFTYTEWNDITDKIMEVLNHLGLLWDSTYSTFDNTKMTAANKTITAARFNSARYNVGLHYPTGLSEVSTGELVYGTYLLTLVSKLNDWIDTL